MTTPHSQALREALGHSPDNHALRLLLADALAEEGEADAALDEYALLLERRELADEDLVRAGQLALQAGRLQLAGRCLEAARRTGVVDGVGEFQRALEAELAGEGVRMVDRVAADVPGALDLESGEPIVTFGDVGGLEDVKKIVHRLIILPFQRPDLYERYGRRVGAGVMLYGPPGCGKTLLARATAGECGLPFFNVRIEDVVDPHFGVSEHKLHDAFELARANAPCVLFVDELDALAYSRRKQPGGGGRALVDQVLQELDAIGADNRDLLVLSATNAPWDVDDGLKRPGRLDRLIFVPPPDAQARAAILALHLRDRPTEGLDLVGLARETPLYSGADLRAVVEKAIDEAIEVALDGGEAPPISMAHLRQARASIRPSTLDWLGMARNYVEFGNQSSRYDDVLAYLRTREVKGALKG